MSKEIERCKTEEIVVLECERCGHREHAWEAEMKACPICGGPLCEAPEFEFEDEERRCI